MEDSLTFFSSDASMAMAMCDELLIVATGRTPISDLAASESIRALHVWHAQAPALGMLNFSPTEAPSAKQRKEMMANAEQLGFNQIVRLALLSESALVRGAMTAISWLVRSKTELRALRPSEYPQALAWLHEKVRFDPRAAEAQLSRLRALLDASSSLGAAPKSKVG